jgi:hypothetical protein
MKIKKIGIILSLFLLASLLLSACGKSAPTAIPFDTPYQLVKSYETNFNGGNVTAVTNLFNEGAYISVRNRVNLKDNMLDQDIWSIFIDLNLWTGERVAEKYHLTFDDYQTEGIHVLCTATISIEGHTVTSDYDFAIQSNKITALSITNQSFT